MTTILGIEGQNWAVLASDALVSDDDGRRYHLGGVTSKIFNRGKYYIAVAGDIRAMNIVRYVFEPPKPPRSRGEKLDKFIVSQFIPELRAALEDQGYAPSDKKEQATHGSSIVVMVNASIYHIGFDYSWIKNVPGVYYAGSGGDFAIGALAGLCSNYFDHMTATQAADYASTAVEIASRYDIATESPVSVVKDFWET